MYAKLIAGLFASSMMVSAAQAAPTIYTNAAAFQAALKSTNTENFEKVAAQYGNLVTTPNFTVAGSGVGIGGSGYTGGNALQYTTNVGTPLTFTFSNAINAFGFDLYGLGTLGATTLSVGYNGSTATLLSNYVGNNGYDGFFGFIDTTSSFKSLTLANTVSGDVYVVDNVVSGTALGAVPEPASWALMIAGFAMVGFAMRRRNKVSTTVSFA